MENIRQFQVGQTYSCTSICDSECVYSFKILKRTAKTVTIKVRDAMTRRTIKVRHGAEQIDPHGKYSMSPVLRAAAW